jgi:hypothetical protein
MKKIITVFLLLLNISFLAGNIGEAYKALSIYDYFLAKKLFYKSIKKNPSEAAFGLATIYSRNDNPFSNIDSAAKYIAISTVNFKDTITYSTYHLNTFTIHELASKIATKGFEKYGTNYSISGLNHYLTHFYFASDSLKNRTLYLRDELHYNYYSLFESSDSLNKFLLKFPESVFYAKAKADFYNFEYAEKVNEKNDFQLKQFLKNYPTNPNITKAELTLFELTKSAHNTDSLYHFIKRYSTSKTKEEAWKHLYSLSVKGYNKQELTDFLTKYPDYPYNEAVLKEISLAQQILIPLKNSNEKFGYIDTLGRWVIVPQFDDANDFEEGFAAVCKNDSCFYINKEGKKTSELSFDEIENYINGIAIVKKEDAYYLLNRSAQLISKGYQDISHASGNLFVCKSNNLYGAINAKGEIIIPFTYNKLGNFKNGYAYYMLNNYGLVNINNKALPAKWDWVSDADTSGFVIVKKANKFGLMSLDEKLWIEPNYDYITPCGNGIYLLVKNNLYGFYNAPEKCMAYNVEFNYKNGLEPSYYSNSKAFKLLKNDEVALADANGKLSISYGTYSDFFFAKCNIIRIQKGVKFGYVDRKLKTITPVEFDIASDYHNDQAIVVKNNNASILDKNGKAIYVLKSGNISLFENNYYLITLNELHGLVNTNGVTLLNPEYNSIEKIYTNILRCTKGKELFLYNLSTKTLKKL